MIFIIIIILITMIFTFVFQKFLRSLPDCLLMSHLYFQWLEVAKETEEAIIVALCKK